MSGAEKLPPISLEHEVDLLEYLNAVLLAKYRILIIATLGAILVFGASKLIDDVYTASAVVAININENPGGVAPKDYRGSDTLGLIEHDFIIQSAADNERERLLARMRSTRFSEIFVRENSLERYVFADHWDASNEKWIEDFNPSSAEAVVYFKEKMRVVELDEKTGLLFIHFKTRDPKLSADLANLFFNRFNRFIRDLELAELERTKEFLNNRLQTETNLEMQRSIYRMLETQLAAESLLFARSGYPLEEIQPALTPPFKSSPQRKTLAILAFVGLIFLGLFVTVGLVLISKLRLALKAYAPSFAEHVQEESPKNDLKDNLEWIEKSPKP